MKIDWEKFEKRPRMSDAIQHELRTKAKEDPLQTVLNRMNARNNSEQTIARFELYVKRFLDYLRQRRIKLKDANCDTFMNYLGDIEVIYGRKLCGSTRATMFYAFRTIYKIWGKEWTLDRKEVMI